MGGRKQKGHSIQGFWAPGFTISAGVDADRRGRGAESGVVLARAPDNTQPLNAKSSFAFLLVSPRFSSSARHSAANAPHDGPPAPRRRRRRWHATRTAPLAWCSAQATRTNRAAPRHSPVAAARRPRQPRLEPLPAPGEPSAREPAVSRALCRPRPLGTSPGRVGPGGAVQGGRGAAAPGSHAGDRGGAVGCWW